jgi:hypothetical protein
VLREAYLAQLGVGRIPLQDRGGHAPLRAVKCVR